MASNTAVAPSVISPNTSEKLVLALGDRTLGESLAAGAFNDINSVDFTLTSAQIKTLNSVPTTIMLAPLKQPTVGNPNETRAQPKYSIIVHRAVAWSGVGTAYNAVALLLQINSVTQATFATNQLTSVGGDVVGVASLAAGQLAAADTALVATAASDPTTGTFAISLRIFYSLVPSNF